MKYFITILLALLCGRVSAAQLWLETESFSDKGGWVVDQQFMDLMGSPYLMAHGMGQPVPDASTTVDIPHKGKWHVYVRTFNWTSPWTSQEGPGAFKVKVGGKTLKTVLGTKGDCWQWQYAGKASLDAGQITALLDQIHLPGQHWHAKAVEFWDVITVQQASGSSGIYSTYSNLNSLIDYVKTNASNPDVIIVFHQTWSYSQNSTHGEFPKYESNQMTMYNMICDAVNQMYNDCVSVAGVIPSGTAIQNARTSYLGDTFNRDGYHLEVNYGRFTAACTWFEALTGKDVTTNPYTPSTVSDSQARVAKAAAHAACQKLIGVTDLVDFKNPPKSDSLTLPSVEEEDGGTY